MNLCEKNFRDVFVMFSFLRYVSVVSVGSSLMVQLGHRKTFKGITILLLISYCLKMKTLPEDTTLSRFILA